MSWEQAEIRELKVNRYMVIDDEPCRIISIQMSKPGKHGEAKARIEAVDRPSGNPQGTRADDR